MADELAVVASSGADSHSGTPSGTDPHSASGTDPHSASGTDPHSASGTVSGTANGLRFSLLGPLEVRNSTGPVPLGAPKLRALVAMLLCYPGTTLAREQLIMALWGDAPPRTAVKNLSVYVYHLRRALGDDGRVAHRGGGYALLVRPDELDVDRFETLAARGRQALATGHRSLAREVLRDALAVWRGPALADLRDVAALHGEAARLDERRLAVLGERIDADLAAGLHADVIAELTRLVAGQPLREQFRAQLMLALYRAGRRADALEVYQQGRATAVERLGIEPGPALQRLQRAILTGDPALDPASAAGSAVAVPDGAVRLAQLPPTTADFTGRAAQVEMLSRLLIGGPETTDGRQPPAVVVSSVAGQGGVGKTALAVHVAHQVKEHFPDGQLYLNLGGMSEQPADPGEVLDWLLRAIGVDGSVIPDGLAERAALYRMRLDGRRVLVVLDDAASESQVRPLLPGSPSCAVLVTSRTRLGGLEGVRLVDLDVLDPDQAVTLLGRIVGMDRVVAEPAAARRIVDLCGLLPLAVRVAGSRLTGRRHRTLAWLAGRLADERRRLDELAHGDLEVRASLALSYQALDPAQQRAFRLLGLAPAPDFASWAASALLDVPVERAEQLLEELFDAQLVEVASTGPQGVRWRFHDLLRVYARELAADERHAPVERFLGACLTLVEEARHRGFSSAIADLRGSARRWPVPSGSTAELLASPAAWFEVERRLLVGAVELACTSGLAELAWELANSLSGLCDLTDCLDDSRHTTELALAAARQAGDRRGEAVLCCQAAWQSAKRDKPGAALDKFEQAQRLFEEIGETYGAAVAEASVGVLNVPLGRHDVATERLRRVLPVLRKAGDLQSQAYVLRAMGTVHLELGRAGEAADFFAEGLELARKTGFRYAQLHLLRWLGGARMEQDRCDEARALAAECMDVSRQLGSRVGEAMALLLRGQLDLRQGRRDAARAVLTQCLQIADEAGDAAAGAQALHQLGCLCLAEARHAQAIAHLRRALAIAEPTGRPLMIGRIVVTLGDAYQAAGDHQQARSCHGRALDLFRQMGVPEAGTLARRLATEGPP
jgi:DNA-binding SARP family transcriptional activator